MELEREVVSKHVDSQTILQIHNKYPITRLTTIITYTINKSTLASEDFCVMRFGFRILEPAVATWSMTVSTFLILAYLVC
jgi:hypothetical protein